MSSAGMGRTILSAAIFTLAFLLPLRGPMLGGPAKPILTAQQRREVAILLTRFRRAKTEPEKRTEAVDGLLKIGGPAPAKLLALITKELAPLQARYRSVFYKAAKGFLHTRFTDRDPKEVDSLRQTVLALRKTANLTKDQIVAKGDPAMAKLNELLWIDPQEILDATPALQTQRKALETIGPHWQRAADHVAEFGPKREGAPDEAPRFEDLIRADEMLATTLTLATNDLDRKALIANVTLEARIEFEEANGIRDLNRMRLLLGLKPLRIDVKLCEAGRDHSKDMVEKKFFAHQSPVSGKREPWDRAKRFGTTAHAENIAAGAGTGPGANRQWFHSPGHHKNMLGGHSRVGLGRHHKTWTQMFG